MQYAKQNISLIQTQGSKRMLAGLMGIFLGGLGLHKFVLGYYKEGFIMMAITIFTCCSGLIITGLIGLVEGIIYLSLSDEDFIATYQKNKKHWL
jgi:TM2 domain-containing membrane protein YozV